MREGASFSDSFQIVDHARAMLHNLRICEPATNTDRVATIPMATESFYGLIVSTIQQKYESELLTSSPVQLTWSELRTIRYLRASFTHLSINVKMIGGLYPSKRQLRRRFFNRSTGTYGDTVRNADLSATGRTFTGWNTTLNFELIDQARCDDGDPLVNFVNFLFHSLDTA
jgi:hypothetical protein